MKLTDLHFERRLISMLFIDHRVLGGWRVKPSNVEGGKMKDLLVEREWERFACWEAMNVEVRLVPDILAYKNLKSSRVNSQGFAIYAHWSHLTLTFAKLFSHLWNKETELNYLEGLLKLWHLWEWKHRYGKWLKIVCTHLSSPHLQHRNKSWLHSKVGAMLR